MLLFKATTSALGSMYQFNLEKGVIFAFSKIITPRRLVFISHYIRSAFHYSAYMHSAVWLVSFREGICRAIFLT